MTYVHIAKPCLQTEHKVCMHFLIFIKLNLEAVWYYQTGSITILKKINKKCG